MKKANCKGCEERYVGCHAKCESYLTWQAEHLAELAHIRKMKERRNDIDECTVANSVRRRREWKKHGR